MIRLIITPLTRSSHIQLTSPSSHRPQSFPTRPGSRNFTNFHLNSRKFTQIAAPAECFVRRFVPSQHYTPLFGPIISPMTILRPFHAPRNNHLRDITSSTMTPRLRHCGIFLHLLVLGHRRVTYCIRPENMLATYEGREPTSVPTSVVVRLFTGVKSAALTMFKYDICFFLMIGTKENIHPFFYNVRDVCVLILNTFVSLLESFSLVFFLRQTNVCTNRFHYI